MSLTSRIEDALIEVYFYSIFGNLHSHFSTDVDGNRLDLKPGRGTVEFLCPQLPFEVTSFKIEASIRRRGSSFNEHVRLQTRGRSQYYQRQSSAWRISHAAYMENEARGVS